MHLGIVCLSNEANFDGGIEINWNVTPHPKYQEANVFAIRYGLHIAFNYLNHILKYQCR